MTLPDLPAERLVLRWLVQSDVSDLFEIFSDPQAMRYWSSPPMTDPRQAEQLVANIQAFYEQGSLFQWGIQHLTDNRIIGTCTLNHIDLAQGRADVGYALHPQYWGQGLMREALNRLFQYAFLALGLRRLEADVDPRNTPSISILKRMGFQQEGLLRERWQVEGEIQDSAIFGLLRREWESKTGQPKFSVEGTNPG
ncbi:MAG: GNAT family N-acetyltransferase [Acidobacteria bacterium]|nr:GNAT family N-acetyltransferase [Acidobacteriota bacterium]MCB9396752.1 GNAT family N-acetyltransferase [Acidobacteriota bacterium]